MSDVDGIIYVIRHFRASGYFCSGYFGIPPVFVAESYKPYGFESRPGQPKAPAVIIVNGLWLVNKCGL